TAFASFAPSFRLPLTVVLGSCGPGASVDSQLRRIFGRTTSADPTAWSTRLGSNLSICAAYRPRCDAARLPLGSHMISFWRAFVINEREIILLMYVSASPNE